VRRRGGAAAPRHSLDRAGAEVILNSIQREAVRERPMTEYRVGPAEEIAEGGR
jgi:hypothetical protein